MSKESNAAERSKTQKNTERYFEMGSIKTHGFDEIFKGLAS